MIRLLVLTLTAAGIGLALPPRLLAQTEVQTGGWAVYIPSQTEMVQIPGGGQAANDRFKGVVIADDPESPLHLLAQNCAGTNLLGPEGTPVRSSGYCVGWVADGDLWWMSFWNGPVGGVWRVVNGTGKFEGMEGGGTSEVAGPPEADGRFTLRWRGTLMMR
jgi:hypothetical protein